MAVLSTTTMLSAFSVSALAQYRGPTTDKIELYNSSEINQKIREEIMQKMIIEPDNTRVAMPDYEKYYKFLMLKNNDVKLDEQALRELGITPIEETENERKIANEEKPEEAKEEKVEIITNNDQLESQYRELSLVAASTGLNSDSNKKEEVKEEVKEEKSEEVVVETKEEIKDEKLEEVIVEVKEEKSEELIEVKEEKQPENKMLTELEKNLAEFKVKAQALLESSKVEGLDKEKIAELLIQIEAALQDAQDYSADVGQLNKDLENEKMVIDLLAQAEELLQSARESLGKQLIALDEANNKEEVIVNDETEEVSEEVTEESKEEVEVAKEDDLDKRVNKIIQEKYTNLENAYCEQKDQISSMTKQFSELSDYVKGSLQQLYMAQAFANPNNPFLNPYYLNPGYTGNNNTFGPNNSFGLDYGYEMYKLNNLFRGDSVGGVTNNYYNVGGNYYGGNYTNTASSMNPYTGMPMYNQFGGGYGNGFGGGYDMYNQYYNNPFSFDFKGVTDGYRYGQLEYHNGGFNGQGFVAPVNPYLRGPAQQNMNTNDPFSYQPNYGTSGFDNQGFF